MLGTIGTLGPIAFETSSEKVRTFQSFKRKNSARYATHDVMGRKPVLEYVGQGLDSISLSMRFDVMLGVSPAEEINTLRELQAKGEAVELVIGGQPLSNNLWVVQEVTEDWQTVDSRGNLIIATVEVTLQEFVRKLQDTGGKGASK